MNPSTRTADIQHGCATRLVLMTLGICALLRPALGAEIIAHRGASADAPENTLAAFKLAYEQGADAAELDIHLTKDGKIVVIHDASTGRTGSVDRRVTDQSLDEIRKLNVGDFGVWQGKGYRETIPTLAEALALVPRGKRLFVEIKCKSEVLPTLAKAFEGSTLAARQMPIITFDYTVAKDAKIQFPEHEVYWLHSWSKDKQTGQFPDINELIRKAKDAGLDGLDLQWQFPIDRDFVKKVHEAGLKLCTWTVDDLSVVRAELDAGVDGITTNRPGWMRQQLAAGK